MSKKIFIVFFFIVEFEHAAGVTSFINMKEHTGPNCQRCTNITLPPFGRPFKTFLTATNFFVDGSLWNVAFFLGMMGISIHRLLGYKLDLSVRSMSCPVSIRGLLNIPFPTQPALNSVFHYGFSAINISLSLVAISPRAQTHVDETCKG
jgi:hypothetical protein